MNLQYLEYLVEIENCGSISLAAKRLFLSQPYLSKILHETEEEYGITIFIRGKRGVSATDSGRLFLDMARDLLDNASNFQRTLRDHADSYRLRVAATTVSHSNDAFIRMIHELPDVNFRFFYEELSNEDVIDHVYTNRSDVGVLMYPESRQKRIEELLTLRRLEAHHLFSSDTQLFCREGHPILREKRPLTLEKICRYNFVFYPSPDQKSHSVEDFYSDSFLRLIDWKQVRQIVFVGSRAALHSLILRSDYLGVGISPILEQEKNYHIVSIPLSDGLLPRSEWQDGYICQYIYQKGRELPKAAHVYITFLEQCYGESYAATLSPGTRR